MERHSRRPVVFSDEEYTEETINVVGRSQAHAVYQFTRSHSNQVPLVNYDRINVEVFSSNNESLEKHFSMAESQASSSSNEGHASVCLAGTSNNIAQLIVQQ